MPDFAGVPIILFTSSDEKCVHKKAADVGADYYVRKDTKALGAIKKIFDALSHEKSSEFQQDHEKRQIQNVLLVDDSSTMRKIIKNILTSIGIANVVEAENGKDGMEKLAANEIDMIISDWSMPVMNGVEMIKRIRRDQKYNNLPIVMVSAEVQEEIEKAMNLGISDYLRKPFNALDMKQLVAKFSMNLNISAN
ncbi:MAG TPA: response regulator [Deltaproteobacteria bacterium]|nr:response regulator [Deltaproteobacteria bacterium]